MRLLFFGTGALGIPALQALIGSQQDELLAVFTQPDRPAGRGLKLKASPIKEFALEHGLAVYQPERLNKDLERVRSFAPDVTIVAAYGQILSKDVIAVPKFGTINIHTSLLPKYRGAAPIQWALINGETETGITTFLIDEGLDTGPVLSKKSLTITDGDTAGTLEAKLALLGAAVMLETLKAIGARTLHAQPQDHALATHAPKIKKEMALIDWTKSARDLFNLIRGLNPAPGAYTFFGGKRLKIHQSCVVDDTAMRGASGEIIDLTENGPIVKTGAGLLQLKEVQPEGKKTMTGSEFVRGYQVKTGSRLG